MKHLKIFFLLIVLMSVPATEALSYPDFEIDGIGFKIIGSEVKVSYRFIGKYIGEVIIPEHVIYNNKEYAVTCIETYAFQYCHDLTSVSIPNSINTIESYAFELCTGLSSIVIPESVSLIGNYPFLGCSGLAIIKVEGGNRYYDSRNNCNAIIETSTNELILGCKNTTIPNGVVSIGQEAFYGCTDLTNIAIPNSVTKIGKWAFWGCSHLTSIIIPGSVKNIASDSFQGCEDLNTIQVQNNNSVYDSRSNCNAIIETNTNTIVLGCKNTIIPSSVTSIGPSAFSGQKSMLSISIPNSVTSIGEWAFDSCNGLTSVTIPNSVTSIGNYAFCGCSGLTSVTIPNSVTSIGNYAFCGCSGLSSVISEISAPFKFGNSAFSNIASTCTLTVPAGAKDAYIAAGWTETVFKGGIIEKDDRTEQTLALTSIPAMTYGDAAYTLPQKTTEGLTLTWSVNNAAVASVSGNILTIVRAGTATVTATQAGNDSYKPFERAFTLTVNKAMLTITADNKTKQEGEENPQLTVSYTGFVNGDDASALTTQPTATTTATKDSPAGTYPITVSGAVSSNYTFNYVNGTLTVTEKPAILVPTDISQMDNAIYIEPVEGLAGTAVDLSVKMKNLLTPVGCSFMLTLPEGLRLEKDEDGDVVYELGTRAKKMSVTMQDWNNGSYDFALTPSTATATISGSDDTFITFHVALPDDMEAGEYALLLTKCFIQSKTDGTTKDNALGNVTTTLTVNDYVMGDVNGDGSVTPSDAIMTLYHYFSVEQTDFNAKAADVNGDNAVTPADAIEILYMYFNAGSQAGTRQELQFRDPQ